MFVYNKIAENPNEIKENTTVNTLRLKLVGDYKNKRNFPINQKQSDFERDIAQKGNL